MPLVAFANIFMSKVETEMLIQSPFQPLVRKRYINDLTISGQYHFRLKYLKWKQRTFLDTKIYKCEKLKQDWVLEVRTHFKPTEALQYMHFAWSHPLRVKKGFIKGEALIVLRATSSKKIFEDKNKTFRSHFIELEKSRFPRNNYSESPLWNKERKLALQPKQREN